MFFRCRGRLGGRAKTFVGPEYLSAQNVGDFFHERYLQQLRPLHALLTLSDGGRAFTGIRAVFGCVVEPFDANPARLADDGAQRFFDFAKPSRIREKAAGRIIPARDVKNQ